MTEHHLRILSSYRDVYSNRNASANSSISLPSNNTHVNDPYVRDFTTTGTQDVTSLILFAFLVTFTACLVLMRISQYCDGQDGQRREQQNNHQQQQPNEVRTQETIEKMILLKKVLSAPVRELDLSRSRKRKKRIERRKSNLFLRSNKAGDELDESRTCPICLCEYEDGESICWSHNKQCAHHFHAQCGIAWLAKHTECPICRANYLVQPIDDQKKSNDFPLSEEPQGNHVITIIEQEENPPENNNEEEYQQSLETMEEGGTIFSASNVESDNDDAMQRSIETPCGVAPTQQDDHPPEKSSQESLETTLEEGGKNV